MILNKPGMYDGSRPGSAASPTAEKKCPPLSDYRDEGSEDIDVNALQPSFAVALLMQDVFDRLPADQVGAGGNQHRPN
jgi:hypothetical protein